MKKILFIVFLLLVFTLVLVMLNRNKEAEPSLTSPSPTVSPSPTPQTTTIIRDKSTNVITGKSIYDIVITKDGALPQNLTIKARDTVRFTNNDSDLHWPASGVHPTHQICPGFDALRGLKQGARHIHSHLKNQKNVHFMATLIREVQV